MIKIQKSKRRIRKWREWELEKLLMKKKWELKVNPKLRESVVENKTKIEKERRISEGRRNWRRSDACSWSATERSEVALFPLHSFLIYTALNLRCLADWSLHGSWILSEDWQDTHSNIFITSCTTLYVYVATGVNQRIYRVVYQTHLGRIDRQTPSSRLAGLEGFPRESIQVPPLDVTLPRAWLSHDNQTKRILYASSSSGGR